jgi:cytochrome c oxidase subunit 1
MHIPLIPAATYQQPLIKRWLLLAIGALTLAGLFSLPAVILRGPFFADILPVEHIFTVSLVLHVDLSVLVWMLAMVSLLWSYLATKQTFWLHNIAFYLALFGMACMAASAFFPLAQPLKNNYVPMLQNLPFILGLTLFFTSIVMQSLLVIWNIRQYKQSVIHLAGISIALIMLSSAAAFFLAGSLLPPMEALGARDFYELLFWGGGHIFQFAFTSLLLCAWLVLMQHAGYLRASQLKIWKIVLLINMALAIPAFLIYFNIETIDDATPFFTRHMIQFGGIAPALGGLLILWGYFGKNEPISSPIAKHYLWLSLLLFGYGGVLGHLISGVNASIPAHYHGSIVGITLALMGMALIYLEKVGYGAPSRRLALVQVYLYAVGQACHISGLALMGGYGALRKSPGSSASVDTIIGKAMFFSGGAMAITGGLLFVIVAYRAIRKRL